MRRNSKNESINKKLVKEMKHKKNDELFFNKYLSDMFEVCQLIDNEYKNKRLSPETKRKLIISIATYFCGNVTLKNNAPPIQKLDHKEHKETYYRFTGQLFQLIPHWKKVIDFGNLDKHKILI